MSEEQLPTLDIASHNLGVKRGAYWALQNALDLLDTLPLSKAIEQLLKRQEAVAQEANNLAKPYCAGLEVGPCPS